MASVFGISELRSKLDEWRGFRKSAPCQDLTAVEPIRNKFTLVGRDDEGYDLSVLLENLVIPRLIADLDKREQRTSEPVSPQAQRSPRPIAITEAQVWQFTRMSLNDDAPALLDFVDQCLKSGSSVEALYIDLLAPAARKLGEYWAEDSEDFVGVTMGLWRIQEVLRELTLRIPQQMQPGMGQRSVLFAPMPGEQHSLGTLMVSECFQRAGWDTDVLIEPAQSELRAKLAKSHYDLIGLTVSCDCPTATLSSVVSTLKSVSLNPTIFVMLGGRVINEQPGLVDECGADATAMDAVSAVAIADQLVPVRVQCLENLV